MTPTYADCCQQFSDSYDLSALPEMKAIERAVLGCDYGGTSWTTMEQAERMQDALQLAPADELLDVGSGSGWPALYMTSRSGCRTTLLDLPHNALEKARERANADGIASQVSAVAGSGDRLPFVDDSFDAISHSDVLCCLPAKQRVLDELRRVARSGARMSFAVIFVEDGLSAAARAEAIEAGPPFIDANQSYPDMLDRSGWSLMQSDDETPAYRQSLVALVDGLENSAELAARLGVEAVEESLDRRLRQIAAIDAGIIRRESYLAAL